MDADRVTNLPIRCEARREISAVVFKAANRVRVADVIMIAGEDPSDDALCSDPILTEPLRQRKVRSLQNEDEQCHGQYSRERDAPERETGLDRFPEEPGPPTKKAAQETENDGTGDEFARCRRPSRGI